VNKDVIIDKIKKLLRMKRGGTAAEIETALQLAQELAAKHGIDIATINPDEETRRVGDEDIHTSARLQWECKYSMLICEHFFNVSALVRRSDKDYRKWCITIIGTSWDRQIASYVYAFLVGHFRREWSRRRGRCRNRQAFMYGMFCGLTVKLKARIPTNIEQSNALVILQNALAERKQYMSLHYSGTTTQDGKPDHEAMESQRRGYIAGKETEINSGITNSDVAVTPSLRDEAIRPLLA